MEKILVIGAGPAGSACAWRLSREGFHCVLVDASRFPRHKVCGGALSSRAVNSLSSSGMLTDQELDDLTLTRHTSMTISGDFNEFRTFRGGTPPVRLVNRTEFDSFIRRRALEEGAIPLTDSFEEFSGTTALFSSGEEIEFQRIIGADGASSKVRRSLRGSSAVMQSPALSVLVPLSRKAIEPFKDKGLHIYFFSGFHGYGWVFPREEDVIAGVGSFQPPHEDLKDVMNRLMIHSGLGISHPVLGSVLPAGRQPVDPGEGRCMLVGDAAGLCDRVSGEGISYAVESGLAAAEAVIAGRDSWYGYSDCSDRVKQSLKYSRYLYGLPFRKLALHALKRNDRWYRKYWSIISGEAEYKSLFRVK